MEVTVEIREDPPEEIAKSSLPARAKYRWVAEDVQTQHSLFRWSRVLKSWLNCIPVFERGARRNIVALERVNAIDCVCHGQEGASEGFSICICAIPHSSLRKEKVAKAKNVGNTEVPNLQDPLVEVHIHGGTKRKADVPTKQGGGKDVKRVRAALLGPRSSSGANKPKAELTELPETTVRRNIDIKLSKSLVNSIDNIKPNAMVNAMLQFSSKALILGRMGQIIQEHINDFQKGLRQVAFFHNDIDMSDTKFDVNKDVVDGQLVNEVDSSPEEEAKKVADEVVVNTDEAASVEVHVDKI
ncbi:hypothetical protein DEO72_LG1g2737 [Vigna unguiculata]|uniref:Uncharacterized protein n=1 Tax=Vigna unguiculata TaxID=3917 RepID=A0A4D6KN59_VIGUN|nr:hypothetical protein DEO72_LG1g2737 [Vigna unguiculata]